MNARVFRQCPIAIVVLLCAAAFAQADRDYPHKQTVEAYVAAFNSGDDAKMSAFFSANLADASLQQRPMPERLDRYHTMRGDLKSLTLLTVTDVEMSPAEQSVTTNMRAGNGDTLAVTFLFDPKPPNKLQGLRIEPAGGPDAASGPAQRNAPANEAAFKQQLAAYLDDASKRDEFSGVVMITRHGAPIFQHAYGFADKVAKTPNQLDTKFNLGSINKVFTRLSIEQLAAAGKLSMDDTIAKVLPDYPNKDVAQKVNVRQLLNMSSGIGDFFGERYQATPKEKLRKLADYLPLFADKPLLFEPGKGQAYSNGGYVVLGLIIEKLSGQSYYDYVKQHIFAPAGMTDTDSYLTDQQVANRAEGYTKKLGDGKDWINNRDSRPARGSSAGGGYATAGDLVKFTEALASGQLKSSMPGLGAAGGAPGINAAIEYDPAKGLAIVVLSNYDPPSAERVARQIREWIRGI
jgi:D-alanyl-D-alanine carboxypeptidase